MTLDSLQARRGVTPYSPPERGPRFLSDVIIELGLADADHVAKAVEDARASHATVGEILVQHGRLSDDDLARAFAARYGLGHIDLDEFEVDPEAANLLPPEAARRYNAVPLAFEPDGTVVVVERRGLQRVHPGGSRDWVIPKLGQGGSRDHPRMPRR